MNKKIIVTGVGGGAGQSILKCFQNTPYHDNIIAVDSEPLGTGLYSTSKAYLGKYASDPKFITRLLEIAANEDVGIIFPGHDVELAPLSQNISQFLEIGVIPIISNNHAISVSDDKLATAKFLKENNFPFPKTYAFNSEYEFEFPIVLKPRYGGARSKNTYIANNAKEFNLYSKLIDTNNCVIQEFIAGDEYTCGSLTLNNSCLGTISMQRSLRSGDTYKAHVIKNNVIDKLVKDIAEKLNIFGPLNVQLKLHNNIPYVFEFNARCSGTTGARALAGFNEPLSIAEYIFEGKLPKLNINEVTILRYWKELVVEKNRITELSANKSINNSLINL